MSSKPRALKILIIDTARKNLSLSIVDEERCLCSVYDKQENNHGKNITNEIQKLVAQIGTSLEDISAIAINRGPGSFTGLRVGASVTKGICYALNIPLISLDGLEAYAKYLYGGFKKEYTDVFLLLDARRDNYFYSHVSNGDVVVKNGFSHSSDIEIEVKRSKKAYVHNSSEEGGMLLRSEFFREEATLKYINKQFCDVKSFEPLYLLNNYKKK